MKITQKEMRRPTLLRYLDKTKEWEFQSFLRHAIVMGSCLVKVLHNCHDFFQNPPAYYA